MVECVERPADPKILLDIANRRTKPVRCRQEKIELLSGHRGDDSFISRAAQEGSSGMVSAGSIKGLRKSCIQIGIANRPARRSSHRSEERRVGKEWRSGGSREQ